MLDMAGKDSSSHRDANRAADALMLSLRGRLLSSSNRAVRSSLSNCAKATAFSFARCWSLISGGSKMGQKRGWEKRLGDRDEGSGEV